MVDSVVINLEEFKVEDKTIEIIVNRLDSKDYNLTFLNVNYIPVGKIDCKWFLLSENSLECNKIDNEKVFVETCPLYSVERDGQTAKISFAGKIILHMNS